MKLNYYEFPLDTEANVRFKNGTNNLRGECTKNFSCRNCEYNKGDGWINCEYYVSLESEYIISGLKVSEAKRLLKEFGGTAYTLHSDRSGSVFETTEIKLKGNNTRTKYNHHL